MKLFFYKNSVLATFVSIFGTCFFAGGVAVAVYEDVITGIILTGIGILLLLWASRISAKKVFKKWKKQLKKEGILSQLLASQELRMAVYKQFPHRWTLKMMKKSIAASLKQEVYAEKKKDEVNQKLNNQIKSEISVPTQNCSDVQETQMDKRLCEKCGAQMNNEIEVCMNCGTVFGREKPFEISKKTRIVLGVIIGSIFLIVYLFMLISYFAL